MGTDNYRGAERVYGWSFYSQGAAEGKQVSADPFIASALEWFGDPDPTRGSPWDKGERLAELVRKQRTLLILDGLEPLQYPPGELGGRLKDAGLQSLLRELARHNHGLCIITTRLEVDNLKEFNGTSMETIDLGNLSAEAGAELLKNFGVTGTDGELKEAINEFDGHALALTLLGSYLAVAYHGDIRQRDKVTKLMKEKKQGGHAIRVMESYEKWFAGKPELDILRIMGLFDRPAPSSAVEAIKAKPAIEGLTTELQKLSHEDWQYAVNNLRSARLLAPEDPNSPDTLDAHPLIREHFGEKLKESNLSAWKEAHSRLYEYYRNSQPKEYPETLEEMAPLFAAVAHGCQAGRYQEALREVFYRRMDREEGFVAHKLGAMGALLATLAGFFEKPWQQPVNKLDEGQKAYILSVAGFCLRSLGRLTEAAPLMGAALAYQIVLKNWEYAARDANNCSENYLTSGDLHNALKSAKQSVELADRSGDTFHRMATRTGLANALHQTGRFKEARNIFNRAEEMQKEFQPQYPLLYSLQGFHYRNSLLDQGKWLDVQNWAKHTLKWIENDPKATIVSLAVEYLSLGHSLLLQAQQEGTSDFAQAEFYLNQAVKYLRQAGTQHLIPHGLLSRAVLYRLQLRFEPAQRDLNEAMTIATRGGMRLHEADCHLEYARLYLAMGGDYKSKAREHLAKAKAMINDMGYHRRDKEVEELEKRLMQGQ